MDADGDGKISPSEMAKGLEDQGVSPRDADKMIKDLDKDGSRTRKRYGVKKVWRRRRKCVRQVHPGHVKNLRICVRQVHPGQVKKLSKICSAGPSGTGKKLSNMCSAGPSGTGKKPSKMFSAGPSGTSKKHSKMCPAGPSGTIFLLTGGRPSRIFQKN